MKDIQFIFLFGVGLALKCALLFFPPFVNLVFGSASAGASHSFGLKLPLLLFDIALFYLLQTIVIRPKWSLLFLYWLNPILIFITYIAGQYELAAIFCCVFSLWLLSSKKQTVFAAMALAAGTLQNGQMALALPLILVYCWNQKFVKDAAKEIGWFIAVYVALVFMGYGSLDASEGIKTVEESFKAFGVHLSYGTHLSLHIGLLALTVVLVRLCLATAMTTRGLYLAVGFVFGTLLVVSVPHTGWYVFVHPYFAIFFVSQTRARRFLYWIHALLFSIYFAFEFTVPSTNAFLTDVVFTLLQASLVAILGAIWFFDLRYEVPISRRWKPLIIGLAGDSGSGKDEVGEWLGDLFGDEKSVTVAGDDYHRWERGDQNWSSLTHLNPRANALADFENDAATIAKGRSVDRAQYDHRTGKFTRPRETKSAQTLIVQGLHAFYFPESIAKFDLKIFLDPDPMIRLFWKIARDTKTRSSSPQAVLESVEKRREDAALYIQPQREAADWVIEFLPASIYTEADAVAGLSPQLRLRHVVPNEARVVQLLNEIGEAGAPAVSLQMRRLEEDFTRLEIDYQGDLSIAQVEQVAKVMFPNLRSVTRADRAPHWRLGLDGYNQLMALTLIERAGRMGS